MKALILLALFLVPILGEAKPRIGGIRCSYGKGWFSGQKKTVDKAAKARAKKLFVYQ